MEAAARPSPRKEGWTTVDADLSRGRPPSQRSLHAAATLRDSLYVFGGYDGLNRVNDFYEFNFRSGVWREIVTANAPLGGATGVGVGGGGVGGGGGADRLAEGMGGLSVRDGVRSPGGTVTATGKAPSPRDRHAAVVHRSSLYIFGGFDGTSRVSDLYGFDADRRAWREVRPRHAAGNVFAPRAAGGGAGGNDHPIGPVLHHDDPRPDREVFGHEGERGAMPRRQQQQHQQQQQPQFHPPPSPRHSHAAVVYGSCMYVFGGYDGSYRSDFHEFDFDQLSWRPVPASGGRAPRARYRSTACVRGDSMILFGGHDGTRHLADVHVYDFVGGAWSLLVARGVPPLPRDSHVSVAYKESMYVFGGSTGSAMNDLYELNFHPSCREPPLADAPASDDDRAPRAGNGPEDGAGGASAVPRETLGASATWRQIPPAAGGVAVHRFCHVGCVHGGSLYVFGGYDGSSRLNDFVRYDLAADNLFDTSIPSSTILSELHSFLDDEEVMSFADITLMVEGIPVRAHKLMLMRCPYFRAMLLGEMAESSQAVVNVEIVRHPIFLAVREYLYTDTVAIPLDIAMELFVAADCFGIPRLQAMCEQKLLESMTVENAATIFLTADTHSATSLRDKVLGYILLHFEAVSKTAAFEDMVRSNVELVFEILKSR